MDGLLAEKFGALRCRSPLTLNQRVQGSSLYQVNQMTDQAQMESQSDETATSKPKRGQIRDFISGRLIRATPEELDAVQVFSVRLVEDFGYPREVITTRPQFHVRARPSGASKRGYPIDIAVFNAERKLEDDLLMVVECKKKTEKEGKKQLQIYMSMSSAEIGVWFNGDDHLYIRKKYLNDGTLAW